MEEKEILDRLRKLRAKDPGFRGGKIVSSVSTEPLEVALDAYRMFSDVNALDSFLFSSPKALEDECIGFMGRMLSNPQADGYVSSGGTESNLTALYAAKKMYPGRTELIVPRSAHYSIEKAADLLGLRIKWVGLDERYRADLEEIEEAISADTLGVVATAGTSALGVVDPVEEIDGLCDDIYLHIDAAFGGFVLPFIDRRVTDFRLRNLDSVTIDPHKMGLAPIPSGAILFRDESYMAPLRQKPEYLSVSTYTLSGSRPAGALAATWATFMYYGLEGYRKIVGECMDNTRMLCEGLEDVRFASLVTEPEINMLGIRFQDLGKAEEALKEKGWGIAANKELSCMRFVVMPHVTGDAINRFLSDLKEIKEERKPGFLA